MLSKHMDIQGKKVAAGTKKPVEKGKSIVDKHAPLRQMSQRKQKFSTKPQIINSIINSIIIKTRQAIYYITHFLCNNLDKVTEYKKRADKLNWHKNRSSKKTYFSQQFDQYNNNLKVSQKLIGIFVNHNSKGQNPQEFILMGLSLQIYLVSILLMWVPTKLEKSCVL